MCSICSHSWMCRKDFPHTPPLSSSRDFAPQKNLHFIYYKLLFAPCSSFLYPSLDIKYVCAGRVGTGRVIINFLSCPKSWMEGGLPYKNDQGALWKFSKNTVKGTSILFERHGLNIFLPQRGTNFKQHMPYSVNYVFSSQHPTVTQ